MARYVCSYLVKASHEQLPSMLKAWMDAEGLEIKYQNIDYCTAREATGRVPFSKLVTVEAFIDHTALGLIPVTIVVKNDELPIYSTNYCWQRFQAVVSAIAKDPHWQVIEEQAA